MKGASMPSYNKVLLMGNLTRDVEIRTTPGNQNVANFGLAINRHFRTQSGEQREETTFVDCEAWGRTAEVMSQYLSKGKPVFVEGRLKLDTWQDKESGQNRSKMRIVVESFQFIDSRGGGEGGGGGGPRVQTPQRSAPQPANTGGYEPIEEEDIPF